MKAKPQVELAFPPAPAPTVERQCANAFAAYETEVLPLVAAAVARITATRAASLFDASPSYLADALKERQDKGVRLAWLVALLIDAPEATKLELLAKLCEIAGYRSPERARPMSPEEENRARRRAMGKFLAPELIALIEQEVESS